MNLKSNEPFWLVKNGLINSYPSLRNDIETDLLIVGGGITGSLIAHRCMQEGYHCTLIDRREVANGSTSASTAMLQYEIDVPLYKLIDMIGVQAAVESYQACHDAIDTLAEIVKSIKSDCGFKKKDSIYFSAYQKDVPWLKQEFEARKKHGFKVQWMDPDELSSKYGLQHTYGGIRSLQGASIDAFKLTHDLLAFNHKRGLNIFDKTDIAEVQHKADGVLVSTAHGSRIKAKKIIYCNGFESVELIKDNFVNLLSSYAIVGEQAEDDQSLLKNTLFWNTAEPYIYMRTTDDNRLLMGGGDVPFIDAKKRDSLLRKKSKALVKQINKVLPNYDFRTDFSWTGTFGETKDGLPYIGEHPDFKSTYFVLAFGGNGITFSVIGMDMVVASLSNNKHKLNEYFRFRR